MYLRLKGMTPAANAAEDGGASRQILRLRRRFSLQMRRIFGYQ